MDRQANLSEDSGLQSLNVWVNDCNKVFNGYFLKIYETNTLNHMANKTGEKKKSQAHKARETLINIMYLNSALK